MAYDPEIKREDEEDEEVDESEYKAIKDAILFAIEVSPSMLEPPPPSDSKKADTDSATTAALKCAYQLMQQRIISNPNDVMGILLFGTQKSKFQDDDSGLGVDVPFPHCYLLNDLEVPSAEDVRRLKSLVEDQEESAELLIPSTEEVSMTNVLFGANQIFTRKAPNFNSRRLFIVTDRDDPHTNDKGMRTAAATRAKDLYDLGIIIELFPISRGDREFDRTKFYDDIIYRDPADPEAPQTDIAVIKSEGDGLTLLQSLISSVNSKQTPKRALFANLPLEIGPGLKISVKGYNVLSKQSPARSHYIYMNGPEAQIVKSETTMIEADSARTVTKTELRKAYKFGGSQVLFTPEEQKELKNFGPPGIKIIGFKPASMIPDYASVSKSTFIYPSEEGYVGSTRVFSALWSKLLRDEKVGLAWYIARANAKPQIVALYASPPYSDAILPTIPAGIWLHPLPFIDDVRNCPDPLPPKTASNDLVDKMRIVIQQLTLPGAVYDPARYPNPSLQWHYRVLQCIALEEELPEDPSKEDKTIPRYRQINKRCGEYIKDWFYLLEKEAQNSGGGSAYHQKHIATSQPSGSGPAIKKVKTEEGEADVSNEELRQLLGKDHLKKLTIAQLKPILMSRDIDVHGKKADMIERLEQWLERL